MQHRKGRAKKTRLSLFQLKEFLFRCARNFPIHVLEKEKKGHVISSFLTLTGSFKLHTSDKKKRSIFPYFQKNKFNDRRSRWGCQENFESDKIIRVN